MTRSIRFAAYVIAAASLAACSSSPMGPDSALKCNADIAPCVNADFVNPNIDFVNPNIDFVNPNV